MTAADNVLVFGAGPIGQAILLAAADLGAQVMVVDRIAARLGLAQRLGAAAVVDASVDDTGRRILEWTDGDGPTVVFEATGVPAVVEKRSTSSPAPAPWSWSDCRGRPWPSPWSSSPARS